MTKIHDEAQPDIFKRRPKNGPKFGWGKHSRFVAPLGPQIGQHIGWSETRTSLRVRLKKRPRIIVEQSRTSSKLPTPAVLFQSLISNGGKTVSRSRTVLHREHLLNLSIVTGSCDFDAVWHPPVPSMENPLHDHWVEITTAHCKIFQLDLRVATSFVFSKQQLTVRLTHKSFSPRTIGSTMSRCPVGRLLWLYCAASGQTFLARWPHARDISSFTSLIQSPAEPNCSRLDARCGLENCALSTSCGHRLLDRVTALVPAKPQRASILSATSKCLGSRPVRSTQTPLPVHADLAWSWTCTLCTLGQHPNVHLANVQRPRCP